MGKYLEIVKKRITQRHGEPTSLDELAQTVIQVIEGQGPEFGVAGFCWSVTYSEEVSNSHDAPINGETNWGHRDSNVPTGYPGWVGRVWIRYKNLIRGFGSGPFGETLTHTGTGGAGSYNGPWAGISTSYFNHHAHKPKMKAPFEFVKPEVYSWDYRFFEDDWPEVKQWRERQLIMDILGDKDRPQSHYFLWNDPEQQNLDQQYLSFVKDKVSV